MGFIDDILIDFFLIDWVSVEMDPNGSIPHEILQTLLEWNMCDNFWEP